jgi:hypothetical protein
MLLPGPGELTDLEISGLERVALRHTIAFRRTHAFQERDAFRWY